MAVPVNPRGIDYECLLLENIAFGTPPISPLFSQFTKLLFVGGNHQPWILMGGGDLQTEKAVGFECKVSGKTIVSVGSVGQPRDGDPRACYVIVTDESVIWRRVNYDVDRTVAKIEATDMLDRRYAMRLRVGV